MKKIIKISALVLIALVSVLTQANVFNKAGQWARKHQEIIVPLGIAGTAALGAGAHQWYKSRQPSLPPIDVTTTKSAFKMPLETDVQGSIPSVQKDILLEAWQQQTPTQQAEIRKGAQEFSRLRKQQQDLSTRAGNLELKGQEFFKKKINDGLKKDKSL